MAYTTDRTWVDGELVPAAYFNAYMRDNLKWLHTEKPMVRCYDDAGTFLGAGAETAAGVENALFDNASMHETTVEGTEVATPVAGKYLIGGNYNILTAASATGRRRVRPRVNGTTYIAGQNGVPDTTVNPGNTYISLETLWAFAATDYFEMTVYQNSGSDGSLQYVSAYTNQTWALWVAA